MKTSQLPEQRRRTQSRACIGAVSRASAHNRTPTALGSIIAPAAVRCPTANPFRTHLDASASIRNDVHRSQEGACASPSRPRGVVARRRELPLSVAWDPYWVFPVRATASYSPAMTLTTSSRTSYPQIVKDDGATLGRGDRCAGAYRRRPGSNFRFQADAVRRVARSGVGRLDRRRPVPGVATARLLDHARIASRLNRSWPSRPALRARSPSPALRY